MEKELTAKDIKGLMLRTYRRYSNGEISEGRAYRENTMLANILKSIEISETTERLSNLEKALNITQEEE
jgi:hypothetical protein